MTCCPCACLLLTGFILPILAWKYLKKKGTCHPLKNRTIYFHRLQVLLWFFTFCDPIVWGIVRKLPLLHYSFMKITAANLFVWREKMCTNRGMNSSTLNDPFQPPWWRDCFFFFFWPDLFDLLSFLLWQLFLVVLMFCPCVPWFSGRCDTLIKWRSMIHAFWWIFSFIREFICVSYCSCIQLYFTLCRP